MNKIINNKLTDNKMKKVITIVPILLLMMTLFVSCGGLDGTYIAKNDAAKQGMYQKFIFKGGKVRVIMGAMGIQMPGGYEYGFKREGDKISIELGVPGTAMSLGGVDLHYDEKNDEISLLFGGEVGTAMNQYAPVWGKEGSFDPNAKETTPTKQPEVTTSKPIEQPTEIPTNKPNNTETPVVADKSGNCIETLETPKTVDANTTVKSGETVNVGWIKVDSAQDYIVNWSLADNKFSQKTNNNTSISITLPGDITGTLYVDVYACGSYCGKWVQSSSPLKFSIMVEKNNSITMPKNGGVYYYNVPVLASSLGLSYPMESIFIPIEEARKIRNKMGDNNTMKEFSNKILDIGAEALGKSLGFSGFGWIIFAWQVEKSLENDYFIKSVESCKDGGFVEVTVYVPGDDAGVLPYRTYGKLDNNQFIPNGEGHFTSSDQLDESKINALYKN